MFASLIVSVRIFFDLIVTFLSYEAAILDYKEAVNINPDNRGSKDGLKRAEKLLKQSKKRDYYKILGVPRLV